MNFTGWYNLLKCIGLPDVDSRLQWEDVCFLNKFSMMTGQTG